LKIPRKFGIFADELLEQYPEWKPMGLSEDSVVGLFVALLKFKPALIRRIKSEQIFTVGCLPEASCGLFHDESVLQEVKPIHGVSSIYMANRVKYQNEYAKARVLFPALTIGEFFWGVCNALTHTFDIDSGEKNRGIMALIDLINHSAFSPKGQIIADHRAKPTISFKQRLILGQQVFRNYFGDPEKPNTLSQRFVSSAQSTSIMMSAPYLFWKYGFIESKKFPIYFDEDFLKKAGVKDEMKLWFIRENQKMIRTNFQHQICWISDQDVEFSPLFEVLSLGEKNFDSFTIRSILDRGRTADSRDSMAMFVELLEYSLLGFNSSVEEGRGELRG